MNGPGKRILTTAQAVQHLALAARHRLDTTIPRLTGCA